MLRPRWLILVYKLPSNPSKLRLYIWRKFKRLNAQYLQESVVILPFTERTLEHFIWINQEIKDLGGKSFLSEATSLFPKEEAEIKKLFIESSTKMFNELLTRLDNLNLDNLDPKETKRIIKDFALVKASDYFNIDLRYKVEAKLEELLWREKS